MLFSAIMSISSIRKVFPLPLKNQSVENAGVASVKGANERNEFFEKINKQ